MVTPLDSIKSKEDDCKEEKQRTKNKREGSVRKSRIQKLVQGSTVTAARMMSRGGLNLPIKLQRKN